jgi:hypothetical protein
VGEVSEKEGLNELQKKSASSPSSPRLSPPEEGEKDEDEHEGRR